MNDSVPMFGLIALCVAVIVGLYALDVAPRQGSFASNRGWLPSYTATSSSPSYSSSSPSYTSSPATAPAQATQGTPPAEGQQQQQQQYSGPQQAPAPNAPLQYDSGQSPQYQQGAAPQYGQGTAPPSDQAPQQPQQQQLQQQPYGPPAP